MRRCDIGAPSQHSCRAVGHLSSSPGSTAGMSALPDVGMHARLALPEAAAMNVALTLPGATAAGDAPAASSALTACSLNKGRPLTCTT